MSITPEKSKVCIYIDGFNLYHAIDGLKQPHLKWFNLAALGSRLLRANEILSKVHYFTTVVDWNVGKAERHETYIAALKAKGVTVTPGNFKMAERHCKSTGNICPFREEKQTDVAIGINIVADAFSNAFDRMILVTADTDQIPVIEMVIERFPEKQVTWLAPPFRMKQAREIGQLISDRSELTSGLIGTCRLPRVVMDDAGNIICSMPNEYAVA